MTKKEDLDWNYILSSKYYECEQNFTLEILYQAFKERAVKEVLEQVVGHGED